MGSIPRDVAILPPPAVPAPNDPAPDGWKMGIGRPKGSKNVASRQGREFAQRFVEDERWRKMIWRWVDAVVNPRKIEDIINEAIDASAGLDDKERRKVVAEAAANLRATIQPMPAAVFNTIMGYAFGKPPMAVKVSGSLTARPYEGLTKAQLLDRARELLNEIDEPLALPEGDVLDAVPVEREG